MSKLFDYVKSIGGLKHYKTGEIVLELNKEIGAGWNNILQNLFTELMELGWNREFRQIKQKLGGLRVYLHQPSEEMIIRVRYAEEQSFSTCQTCGAKGLLRNDLNWIQTLCRKHYEQGKNSYIRIKPIT